MHHNCLTPNEFYIVLPLVLFTLLVIKGVNIKPKSIDEIPETIIFPNWFRSKLVIRRNVKVRITISENIVQL